MPGASIKQFHGNNTHAGGFNPCPHKNGRTISGMSHFKKCPACLLQADGATIKKIQRRIDMSIQQFCQLLV